MEAKTLRITAALAGLFLVWLYLELRFERQIDYEIYDYLVNSSTGARMKPRELLDAEKVLSMPSWYVRQTDSLERLYDLEFGINFGTGFENDHSYENERDERLSGWPVANRTKCAHDLDWIRQRLAGQESFGLIKGQLGLELGQLMDSFGKPESGFLAGNTAWPGSYERCLRTSLDEGRIKTRYCWLRLRPKGWPIDEPVRPKSRVRVGVCLPETCDTTAYKEHRDTIEWLVKLDMGDFYRQNLQADSMFCLPDERSPIRQIPLGGRIYLGLAIAWFALVLACTLASAKLKKRRLAQAGLAASKLGHHHLKAGHEEVAPSGGRLYAVLEAMSVRAAIKSLKSDPFKEANPQRKFRLDLSGLHALKFMMAIMVVLGHSFYMNGRFTRTNWMKLLMGTQTSGLVLMSLGRLVDTFFLLFGLFASYTLLRKVPHDRLASPGTWLAYNLNVLLRLMPLILPLYYYNLLVAPYTSHGPWWDYGLATYSLRGLCRLDPWWKVIPVIGHLGNIPGVCCLPVAWFLAVYSQVSLLVPALTYCLCKLPNQLSRCALLLYINAISSLFIVLKMGHQTTLREETFGSYGALLVDLLEKFESFGAMKSLGRAGCIAIGCYVGYLLRMYELESIRKWPSWFRSRLALASVLALNVLLFLAPFIGAEVGRHMRHRTSLNEFIAGFLVMGHLWAVANSLLIVLAVTTYNRTAIVRFLGHSFWHSANKLGFAIFLVHFEVIYSAVTGNEQGPSLGFLADAWQLFAYSLLVSTLLAFVLHICVETPVNALIALVYQRRATYDKIPPEANHVELVVSGSDPKARGLR